MSEQAKNPARRFPIVAILIAVFALALRLFYIADARVENPIVGDINQYVLYAWNLTHFDTFSSAVPFANRAVVPDSYRGPGYPAMLAMAMKSAGDTRLWLQDGQEGRKALVSEPRTWITFVYVAQAALGSLSVLLTMFVGRFWLGDGAALTAGMITALWPHLVVFSAVMLSETLYGAALLCGLWLLCVGYRRANAIIMALAGIVFGFTYLVNPVIALFPLVGTIALIARNKPRLAIVFMLAYLIAPLGWAARNMQLPAGSTDGLRRVEQNFVQGSWPRYLDALGQKDEESRNIVAAESAEENTFVSDPARGLETIGQRISTDVLHYARWYLLEKPFLLWDWDIRNGWGDVYFLTTERSPYERFAGLSALKGAFMHLNPLFFAFAAIASLSVIIGFFRQRRPAFEISMVALLVLYVSAVHVVLQAEPRYAIPYRFEQVLLALTAIVCGAQWLTKNWLRVRILR